MEGGRARRWHGLTVRAQGTWVCDTAEVYSLPLSPLSLCPTPDPCSEPLSYCVPSEPPSYPVPPEPS